ncbi:hypothetical protein CAOG_00625 [Capsaspora owczarzaki ATCC 30864]|uniref:Uncharacterized protein n=1 Tax=Capsaspora owczarzaki (strain ATCC 30864) TaxID=595528 RepID=A0A0D2WIV7_CAPO3|nr:hypothetical protein CAOG_00625 [Capsaspora owczarzaki ATCC 30864]KJE89073.1 hypothetical protein CAOG_000625 [Capsaspora owczarzaki ATCC 30864]|eukprot:XP_004365496.2 hypothetical protein CAOG_00625 [Capsaspora owczarzaki ATCC 30864]
MPLYQPPMPASPYAGNTPAMASRQTPRAAEAGWQTQPQGQRRREDPLTHTNRAAPPRSASRPGQAPAQAPATQKDRRDVRNPSAAGKMSPEIGASGLRRLLQSRENDLVQAGDLLDTYLGIILGDARSIAGANAHHRHAGKVQFTAQDDARVHDLLSSSRQSTRSDPVATPHPSTARAARTASTTSTAQLDNPPTPAPVFANQAHASETPQPPKPRTDFHTPRIPLNSSVTRPGTHPDPANARGEAVLFTPHSAKRQQHPVGPTDDLHESFGASFNTFDTAHQHPFLDQENQENERSFNRGHAQLLQRIHALEDMQAEVITNASHDRQQAEQLLREQHHSATQAHAQLEQAYDEMEHLRRQLAQLHQERDDAQSKVFQLEDLLAREKAEQLENIRLSKIALDLQQRNAQLRAALVERFAAPLPPGFNVTSLISIEDLEQIIDRNIVDEIHNRRRTRDGAAECIRDLRSLLQVCSSITKGQAPAAGLLLALNDPESTRMRHEQVQAVPSEDEPLDRLLNALQVSRVELNTIRRHVADEYARSLSQDTAPSCTLQ